ncbi:MAG: tRNA (adenosine(37)-N6)-threonylcarbamoyltransferase complex dimerization subunit type 1 TsaB [Clostridia bacterium]|nr:tRNA (adenosine(37)-N6)-threonylcarbamoyltransferase complex dimerization subunit type 1 TsaB [Clostridia bacterium]
MKILAIDTSAVCASVAVTENGKVLSESSVNTGLTHSRTLLPMIDSTLKNAEIQLSDIDFFACSVGPGSFTGVRIGVAAVKGLCDGLDKKAMPVSTLEALAYNLSDRDCVAVPVMDARCQQVYCAVFLNDGGTVTRLMEDSALKIEDLGERLKEYEGEIIFVGDGAEICHKALGYKKAGAASVYQRGSSVAFAAEKNYGEDRLLSGGEIMPAYLRLPQAERELKAKKGEVKNA